MTSGSQFRLQPPPALDGAEYAEELNYVKEIGKADSLTRTSDQTAIAKFWANGAGTFTPPGHWNQIAEETSILMGQSLEDSARLFALLNISLADAAISCWDNKYEYNFWRPVTASSPSGLLEEIDDLCAACPPPMKSWRSLPVTFRPSRRWSRARPRCCAASAPTPRATA